MKMKSTEKDTNKHRGRSAQENRSIHVCLLRISQVINLRARREATAANFSATLSSSTLVSLVSFLSARFGMFSGPTKKITERCESPQFASSEKEAGKYSFGKDAYELLFREASSRIAKIFSLRRLIFSPFAACPIDHRAHERTLFHPRP